EKDANKAADALRKEFTQEIENLLIQAEAAMNVSPIPTSRVISSHPSALILGEPTLAVQTRRKVNKSSGAHAFVSYKGVEFKDIEETDRPRPTSTRSLLTLKPLPKIDPKDKRKKKIEEEVETKSESDGIPEAEKKFKQLASDEEMARKIHRKL
ncbi:hypothetical protein Tco_1198962, partial [Tanacetum coccineum]